MSDIKTLDQFLAEQDANIKAYQPAGKDDSKKAREKTKDSKVDNDFDPKNKPDAGDIPVAGKDYVNEK
ncbi:hypothetical protein EniLVp02_0154 [Vibrio phage EniLVp02]